MPHGSSVCRGCRQHSSSRNGYITTVLRVGFAAWILGLSGMPTTFLGTDQVSIFAMLFPCYRCQASSSSFRSATSFQLKYPQADHTLSAKCYERMMKANGIHQSQSGPTAPSSSIRDTGMAQSRNSHLSRSSPLLQIYADCFRSDASFVRSLKPSRKAFDSGFQHWIIFGHPGGGYLTSLFEDARLCTVCATVEIWARFPTSSSLQVYQRQIFCNILYRTLHCMGSWKGSSPLHGSLEGIIQLIHQC